MEILEITLDPLGRAVDAISGNYLKWQPIANAGGLGEIKLGEDEGLFMTLGTEGDLTFWIRPPDYIQH